MQLLTYIYTRTFSSIDCYLMYSYLLTSIYVRTMRISTIFDRRQLMGVFFCIRRLLNKFTTLDFITPSRDGEGLICRSACDPCYRRSRGSRYRLLSYNDDDDELILRLMIFLNTDYRFEF